jgi:lysyl oxidase-like protein 2/3/4
MSEPVSRVVDNGDGVEGGRGPPHLSAKAHSGTRHQPDESRGVCAAASPGQRDAIADGHGGRSFKLWLKAEGSRRHAGDRRWQQYRIPFAERKAEDGSTLIVAFGLINETNHPGDPAWVRAQAARLFPNARLIAHDWHDWVDDPFARGTWVAALAGREAGLLSSNWQPEGRIAFASSDYARDQAGWFEGAVISGEDAADAVLDLS